MSLPSPPPPRTLPPPQADLKGSGNAAMHDIEDPIGVWNDTVLLAIDALMLRVQVWGVWEDM